MPNYQDTVHDSSSHIHKCLHVFVPETFCFYCNFQALMKIFACQN